MSDARDGLERLVVIDGKSVFYRGYYAMGALATSDGTPTGGVYGFAAIAMEIVKTLAPTKVAVAWDKAKTSTAKRKEIYPEYKAGRVKPPEDFYAQIPLLRELILALGWGFLECDDYEADDIIGTLALQADNDVDAEGRCRWDTYIISSDLDMLQIVDENTRMYRLMKGFTKLEEIDVAAVEAKYGIRKNQFLDLKALKGDASDNIPGVPGVGEKTAVKLLNEYGSVDGIYAHIDEIRGSVHDKLVAGKESAYMSLALAKIMTDAPVSLNEVPELVVNEEKIIGALEKLEFRSLVKKFFGGDAPSFSGQGNTSLFSPTTRNSSMSYAGPPLEPSLRDEPKGAVRNIHLGDSESGNVGENNGRIASNHSSDNVGDGRNIRLGENKSEMMTEDNLRDVALQIPFTPPEVLEWDVKAVMHADEGVAEKVLGGAEFWDLAQGQFLLDPLRKKEPLNLLLMDEQEKKAEYERQRENFIKLDKLYKVMTELDLPLIPVLYKMEKRGMMIDRGYFEQLKGEYEGKVAEIAEEIYTVAGREFNINSPQQLADTLFVHLGLPTNGIKKGANGYSTGIKELEKIMDAHAVVPLIVKYREAAKLLSTYIAPLPALADAEGRVHTTFTQDVTATGRLSSLNPNLQNIPTRTEEGKKIRTGFIAGPGKVLVSADYSQFELRLAAAIAGDEELIRDFNSGIDIHKKTASEAFGVPMDEVTKQQRRAAKVINFGILYGMSAKGLADAAEMSYAEAKQFIARYFELRRPIKEKLDAFLAQAQTFGYVETMFGRRRPTPDVKSPVRMVRAAAERAAQNMPIQGTEADLMKKAMIAVDAALPAGAEMIMQVHDSLIIECEPDLVEEVTRILQEKMEGVAPELPVKLAVEVSSGENWGEL